MNIIVFATREPDHGQTEVFTVIGSGSNDGVSLFFAEAKFRGKEISAGHESSHSRGFRVPLNAAGQE